MRIAHLTCKDCRMELWRYILVISGRAAVKRPVLTRNSGPACMRVYPRYTGDEVHTRRGGEGGEEGGGGRGGSFRAASSGRDQERRPSECNARRAIAMSAVIYEAIILVCRCRGREGCPLVSPLLRSFRSLDRTGGLLIVAYGPPAQLRRARTFIGLHRLFYSR